MNYHERKDFLYDPEIFKREDVQTALTIYREYVVKHSPNPTPRFFEVDRSQASIDPLWHSPVTKKGKQQFTSRSPMDIPVTWKQEKPRWQMTPLGMTPTRRDTFLMSNLYLRDIDYFPTRGDMVYWQGYRMKIIDAVPPPEAYWHQTGVWLGIGIECIVAPEGDARPIGDQSQGVPAEFSERLPEPKLEPVPEARRPNNG